MLLRNRMWWPSVMSTISGPGTRTSDSHRRGNSRTTGRMFDQLAPQIDAVVVSTPDHTHFHPSLMALQLGKHLYCEKPMAHSVWEVRTLNADRRPRKAWRRNWACSVTRMTNMHRVVELIQAGAIGQVRECHCWVGGDRGMPAMPNDFPPVPAHLDWDLWLGPAAERPYSPDYCPYNWRFWWDFGTGETGNWGCHILDIPFWALGLVHPTRVDASGPDIDPQRTPKSLAASYHFPAMNGRPEVMLHWYHAKDGPPILRELTYRPRAIIRCSSVVTACCFAGLANENCIRKRSLPTTCHPNRRCPIRQAFIVNGSTPVAEVLRRPAISPTPAR